MGERLEKEEKMKSFVIIFLVLLSLALMSQAKKMVLNSPAFKEGDLIPKIYTCDGEDLSPQLAWEAPPGGTQSFALICDDPDAPMGTWVHWVAWNIPKDCNSLQKGIAKTPKFGSGIMQGKNSWPRTGYDGPCPPPGKAHRYCFKLYALDCLLTVKENATKEELLSAMKGRILEEASLMGIYKR